MGKSHARVVVPLIVLISTAAGYPLLRASHGGKDKLDPTAPR